MTSPPNQAIPGTTYYLYLNWYNEATGVLADATSVQLDITYGSEAPLVADVAGPFTYTGATSPASDQVWHLDTGQYGFQWQVPSSGLAGGAYVATWTVGYG